MDAKNAPSINAAGEKFTPDAYSVFDDVFDFYGTLDLTGKVRKLSGRVFTSTNTDPGLLLGQVFSETVFWQSSELTAKLIQQAITAAADGEPSRLTIDFRISSDEKTAMEIFVRPLPSDSGNEIFIAGQSIPSNRSEMNGASNQLLFAAENALIGLWYWDFAEDRIYATPRCNELFGLPAYESFRYEQYRESIHPEDRDFVDSFLSTSRTEGTKYEEEFRVVGPNGNIEWICAEGRSFLDPAGKPSRMTGVVQRITEQKRAADEISMVHEREKRAREEAVEANRSKDFFLAFVSHELRSPLNAILGWSKILLTRKVDDDTQRNALQTIERSARAQTKLINDLVDSARVASGKLRLEYRQTNLYDVVRNSWQAQKPSADSKHIDFLFDSSSENIPLFADANRLQQVFGNLMSNAIKFTPEGGNVKVEVKTQPDSVRVEVTDTGHGIDPVALPQIFKQFSQGDLEQTRTNIGLGLGLSIVKILVSKHGGFVQAESDGVGKGSKFTVTLPLSESGTIGEIERPAVTEETRRSLEGVSIFIVEDDADSREVLELFLAQNGAVVKTFDSVRSALSELAAGSSLPDMIISDLGMPDEDGFSLITKIRALPAENGGTIPAIALSAFTSTESREKALDLGFNKYCTKPFEHDLLIKELIEVLDTTAASRS